MSSGNIRRAGATDAGVVCAIAQAAKRHWGYPEQDVAGYYARVPGAAPPRVPGAAERRLPPLVLDEIVP